MSTRTLSLCLAILLACTLAAPMSAAEHKVEFLTQVKSAAAPADVAMGYLRSAQTDLSLTDEDLRGLTVKDQVRSERSGMTHIYYRQTLGGLEVANAVSNVNVAADGRVISMGDRFVSNLAGRVNTLSPAVDARDAILAAGENLGLRLDHELVATRQALAGPTRASVWSAPGISQEQVPAGLALFATTGEVRLAWDLVIVEPGTGQMWNVFVDAVSGDVLQKYSWTAWDSYQVFASPKESPLDGGRTIETNPADLSASPFGWHDTNGAAGADFTDTRGNNVSAQEDRDANNSAGFRPDGGAFPRWAGNLKQYQLGYVNDALRLVDADSASAINSSTSSLPMFSIQCP